MQFTIHSDMETQQRGPQHGEGDGGDAPDAYLIHVALIRSSTDEGTPK
jgi:hypothetical protein